MARKVVKYLGTQPRVFPSVWKGKSIDVGVGSTIEVEEGMADKLDKIVMFNEKMFQILETEPVGQNGIEIVSQGIKADSKKSEKE